MFTKITIIVMYLGYYLTNLIKCQHIPFRLYNKYLYLYENVIAK